MGVHVPPSLSGARAEVHVSVCKTYMYYNIKITSNHRVYIAKMTFDTRINCTVLSKGVSLKQIVFDSDTFAEPSLMKRKHVAE